jgi:hypothetical protein
MSLTNPPPAITALSAMLAACSSATTAGMTAANHWYPSAVAESDDTTTATPLPRMILGEESYTRNRYAEGARGIPQGSLTIVLHVDTDVGTIEVLARAIADDLEYLSQTTGLPNVRCQTGLAAEPDPGQRAADETTGDTSAKFTSITITADYGLTA